MKRVAIYQAIKLPRWKEIRSSINHMVFPEECLICQEEVISDNSSICVFCKSEMHYTEFEKYSEEPTVLDKLFWGRVKMNATFSLLYFEKDKSTQKILHALKYQSNPKIGVEFGKEIGRKIKLLSKFNDLDLIIPVPLHPKKKFVRGYNQSEQIAVGISTVIAVPVNADFLKKQTNTGSQTRRGRFARWDNVVDNFALKTPVENIKHIAIIDDVITTGSTLEALVRSIHKNNPELRVSIISLALAK